MEDTYIRIADVTYDSCVDGPGLRTVIWFSGCSNGCKGCHNKAIQNPYSGNNYTFEEVADLIDKSERVTLSGGDPLFQAAKLNCVLGLIKTNPDIILYTGYTKDEVLNIIDGLNNIKDKVSTFKIGPYIEELRDPNLRFRGSSNQGFFVLKDDNFFDVTEAIDNM